MQKFPKISKENKKGFLRDQCKEIEENNRMGMSRDLFKKIRNTKGRFQAKMGTKRTEMVWTQQKRKLLRRGDKNTQKNYTKKDLHDPDNHDGVITHLEPDILECEVKWALGSITMNKASGGDGIPLELFQILKDNAMKCCTQYASKFGKLCSGHRTRKGQCSFQSQRKAMPKNA